jgi:hypothetical protein
VTNTESEEKLRLLLQRLRDAAVEVVDFAAAADAPFYNLTIRGTGAAFETAVQIAAEVGVSVVQVRRAEPGNRDADRQDWVLDVGA